jgi:DNA-binding response OmpR family regulator
MTGADDMAKRILVVDDDADMRYFVGLVLKGRGYEVTDVETGCEALAAMKSGLYDLVLLDILLPDSNGLDLCQKIKQMNFMVYTPVILLSSVSDKSVISSGLERGADAFMQKPPSPIELLGRMVELLDAADKHNAPAPADLPQPRFPIH